jgi:hypothetical protein
MLAGMLVAEHPDATAPDGGYCRKRREGHV